MVAMLPVSSAPARIGQRVDPIVVDGSRSMTLYGLDEIDLIVLAVVLADHTEIVGDGLVHALCQLVLDQRVGDEAGDEDSEEERRSENDGDAEGRAAEQLTHAGCSRCCGWYGEAALERLVDLGAQPADMGFDDAGLRIEMKIPDALQQHGAGDARGLRRASATSSRLNSRGCRSIGLSPRRQTRRMIRSISRSATRSRSFAPAPAGGGQAR